MDVSGVGGAWKGVDRRWEEISEVQRRRDAIGLRSDGMFIIMSVESECASRCLLAPGGGVTTLRAEMHTARRGTKKEVYFWLCK